MYLILGGAFILTWKHGSEYAASKTGNIPRVVLEQLQTHFCFAVDRVTNSSVMNVYSTQFE